MAGRTQGRTPLKRDALGWVERLERADGSAVVRRVAAGSRAPGSGFVARALIARERRALEVLADLPGVPARVEDPALAALPGPEGERVDPRAVGLRTWLDGAPLHRAESLPRDFFERLAELVEALHARGVCHNDLHKDANVIVGTDGRPRLVDLQLASVHRRRGRRFRARCREDLRHVEKLRRRYVRRGRTDAETLVALGPPPRRSALSWAWRRFAKPVYNAVTRGLLRTRDGEPQRPESGPWPEWTDPVGPLAD